MEPKINAIIIDGKAYVAAPRSDYHRSDCALFNKCRCELELCQHIAANCQPAIFHFSQELTDKINTQ